jgi:hypothetical protein
MRIFRRNDLETDSVLEVIAEPGERGADGIGGKDSTVPGPKGDKGADAKGFNLRGEWRRGTYEPLDVVTHEGSSYAATATTKSEPPGKAWQLLAARGDDGKDGETIAVRGPRGLPGTSTVVSGGSSGIPFIATGDVLKGQPLRVSTAGHCSLADASSVVAASVVGLAASDVADGMAGLMFGGGTLEMPSWVAITGTETLSVGSAYYLSLTGGLTSTPPADGGQVVTFCGRAVSESELAIEVAAPILLSGATEDAEPTLLEAVFDSAAEIGHALFVSSDGHVDLASMANPGVAGISVESVAADATGHYITESQVSREDWTVVTGSASLTPGALYYLDPATPGLLTTTPPEDIGDSVVIVGRALTSTTLDVSIQPPMLLN